MTEQAAVTGSATVTSLDRLSEKNRRVLDALAVVLDREGTASIREIGDAAGLSSSSTVAHHLSHLVLFGFVTSVHNRPRGWRLTEKGRTEVGRP